MSKAMGPIVIDEKRNSTAAWVALAYAFVGAAFATLLGASMSGKAQEREMNPAPLQVMADAVLIDGRCREVRVNFGVLLRYGGEHGIPATGILPLGSMRKSLEAAIARRTETLDPQAICSTLVEQEGQLVRGIVTPAPTDGG